MLQRTIAVYVHTTDVENLNKNRESDLSQATELIQGKLHVSLNDSPSPKPVVSSLTLPHKQKALYETCLLLAGLLLLVDALRTEISTQKLSELASSVGMTQQFTNQ